jgi:endonuclease YncB( thermonuclease family)
LTTLDLWNRIRGRLWLGTLLLCLSLTVGCRDSDETGKRELPDNGGVTSSPEQSIKKSTGPSAFVPIVPKGTAFACTTVQVWDGDGPLWCAEGPRVRLAGIEAREMDGTCRHAERCPPGNGVDARDRLVALLGGPKGTASTGHVIVEQQPLTCVSDGGARGTRTAAWCRRADGLDLSCAMIESGLAVRWEQFDQNDHCR